MKLGLEVLVDPREIRRFIERLVSSADPNESFGSSRSPFCAICAAVGDMRRIAARSRESSQTIRDENRDCREADMFGLVIAMHEAGLHVETRDDLGLCNNWEQRTGPLPRIIHYATRVLDEQGRKLWCKKSYMPETRSFPWERPVAPERAGDPLEGRLLETVHHPSTARKRSCAIA